MKRKLHTQSSGMCRTKLMIPVKMNYFMQAYRNDTKEPELQLKSLAHLLFYRTATDFNS
jgi:hypothetical protein